MEWILLYFFVGLTVFVTRHATRKKPGTQIAALTAAGFISSSLVSLLMGSRLLWITRLPWPGMAVTGGLAALMILAAERKNWMSSPGLRYFSTIILGILVAVCGYGLMRLYNILAGFYLQQDDLRIMLPLSYLLIGFLMIFGYTFPERWLKLRTLDPSAENDALPS
ncbi:MAG TPA: hypothetical protein ENN03_11325 [bacterium]|nr:hypothetical protein [bacterium]